MGRGLSDLQKFILTRALANRLARGEEDGADRGDISRAEVLADYYDFRPYVQRLWGLGGEPAPLDGSWLWPFDRASIGRARYDAASVAVTKAFARLQARDLGHGLRHCPSPSCPIGVIAFRLSAAGLAEAQRRQPLNG